jgi:Flp pilus assembly protein TadB
MTFHHVKLGWVAFAFVTVFVFYGLGLAGAGIAMLLGDHIVGGVAAVAAGSALAVYGVKVALDARRDRFAEWLRDIPHCPP